MPSSKLPTDVEAVREALRSGRLDSAVVAEATGVPAHVAEIWAARRRDLIQDSWRFRLEEWAAAARGALPPFRHGYNS